MIQVLERSDCILSVISEKGSAALKDITEHCGLNKTTTHNILKTLLQMKYVSQDEGGNYSLGSRFLSIARQTLNSQTLAGISQTIAVELAEKTCESGLVTIVRNNELLVTAKHVFDQGLIVNSSVNNTLQRQSSASGRVFAAFLEGSEQDDFISRCYIDLEEEERAEALRELQEDIAGIKKKGISIRLICEREIYAFAVPVYDSNKKICAALGLNIPAVRLNKEKEVEIEKTMKTMSLRMSELIKANNEI
ncbi:MAG: IclR family transcriptional regulator [Planctomycetota bacterium]|jgi:DNA-binding IclR family transcriptional regulator